MSTEGFKVSQEILNELPNEVSDLKEKIDVLSGRIYELEAQLNALAMSEGKVIAQTRYRTGNPDIPYSYGWGAYTD